VNVAATLRAMRLSPVQRARAAAATTAKLGLNWNGMMIAHENVDGSMTLDLPPHGAPGAASTSSPETGLRIYDVTIDNYRPVTQLDLDMMQEVVRAYGELRATVEQQHAEHRRQIAEIRSKAGAAR